MKNLHELDQHRIEHPWWLQTASAGAFKVYVGDRSFYVLASTDEIGDDGIWEHISIEPKNQKRCPTWDEMAEIKAMFFDDEEEAVEFHPKKSKYVNMKPYVLHIWRPVDGILRLPLGAGGDIAPLSDRDERLEKLWAELEDVPVDPETEKLEQNFLHFPAGTDQMEVWRWFDERHSKGVHHLLYGGRAPQMDYVLDLTYYNSLCCDCESKDCAFNCYGECRYPLVEHRVPIITDEDGCLEYCYKEGKDGKA